MTDVDGRRSVGRRRRVTSADVARAAGVSRATVSYVLNDVPHRNISQATRELVRSTAKRLGHMPYAPARALRSGRTNIVLALVPGFGIGFLFDKALDALNTALAARGYALLVHHHAEALRSMADLWGLVSPALVVATGGLTAEQRAAVEYSEARLVDVDGIVSFPRIGRMQAEYLLSKGHRRLGFAMPGDPHLQVFGASRLSGVRAACAEAGLPEPVVEVVDFDRADVRVAVASWRDRPDPVTAVCAHNDDVALVLMAGLETMGLRAGVDLDVVGVDNVPMAAIGVTTVAIDIDALAGVVVASVLAELDDQPPPARDGEFLHLVVRRSA
ncbi:LacI family DNA-binding transcriptional regulator [Polymorphospora rubra]|uniref:LacI family transcriptional regulator n=1 Tax=Polymorphospora rubra TaxID=338584 RepID=A0A810MRR9_9ACTN|nr:LacI family DNA-binding transcriptional regulator [Polymorphospora rubra]BCJ63632.1 LacI family transcriptional regulator [Polymorphospora rubra]